MTRPRVSFYTFGCRLNQAETATLRQCFTDAGFDVVEFGDQADIVVVNTCTVTSAGDTDTRKLVNRVNRQNPEAQIALIGCQSQLQSGALIELPSVRWVVGTARKMELAQLIDSGEDGVILDAIPRTDFTAPAFGLYTDRTRANLKVQDGCDFYCSYCEIPYARGHARSRDFDDVLAEAHALVDAGHQELVTTGINVGCYEHDGKQFLDLIRALLGIDHLQRLRISSIEPTTPPDELLQIMADNPKLCRYLHVPMQSGNDDILKSMNRRYCYADFAEFIYHAAETVPDVCLGTDVIVGFPGESDEQFEDTNRALHELPLAYFHVFSYSDRPNAKAKDLLEPKVPPEVTDERSRVLRALSHTKRRAFMEPFIGTWQSVLVEQKKEDRWNGLTDNFIRVRFPAAADLHNRMVEVQLTEIDQQGMLGRL